jgi:hypothetical protein
MKKYIHEFKTGDMVKAHGAVFRVLHDARESQAHRPQAGHLITAHGPCECAWAHAEWVSGNVVPGYFGPSQKEWGFQGNFLAGKYEVIQPN